MNPGLIPPADVAAAAKKGLELREKFHRGGTSVGVHRAKATGVPKDARLPDGLWTAPTAPNSTELQSALGVWMPAFAGMTGMAAAIAGLKAPPCLALDLSTGSDPA